MKKYCTTIRIIVHTQMKLFRRRSCTMIYTFSCFFKMMIQRSVLLELFSVMITTWDD